MSSPSSPSRDESSSSSSSKNKILDTSSSKPQSPPTTHSFRIRLLNFASAIQQVFLRSIRDDFPLWMASGWLLWNKQHFLQLPSSSSKSISSRSPVVDAILLGSILLWKKARDYDLGDSLSTAKGSDDNNSVSNKTTTTKKDGGNVSVVQELRDMLATTTTITPATGALATMQNTQAVEQPRAVSPTAMALVPPPSTANQQPKQQRYVELMVHNVSHTDLVLSLDAPPLQTAAATSKDEDDSFCLCRPRFSAFDRYTTRIIDFITLQNQQHDTSGIPLDTIIQVPRYERFDDNARNYQIKPEPSNPLDKIPLGFRLTNGKNGPTNDNTTLEVSPSQLKDLRIRGKDAPRIAAVTQSTSDVPLRINAVFFPLLATLMPIWQAKMKEKFGFLGTTGPQQQSSSSYNVKKVLILVTGVGTPRNWTHSVTGNSTFECARLMKLFLHTICPELEVVHIHSGPDRDIFRYDANIAFVQQELLPRVNAYRDAHAKGLPYPDEVAADSQNNGNDTADDDLPFSTEWGKSFAITLSFADGSPARNYAIQAALRSYKPIFFHFWQLKTFWHESKIVDSDIEVHSFEEMETMPAIEATQLGDEKPYVLPVVEEMKRFRDEMVEFLREGDDSNDIRRFWLRKTQKPVLAVLAVKVANGGLKLYRGTNMEVSMPTGSLCAERNVIGSALADNPGLKRQDLKLIAVLAVPVPKQSNYSNRGSVVGTQIPRPLSTNSLASTQQEEDASHVGKPPLVPSRKSSLGEEEDWILQDPSAASSALKNPPSMGYVPSGTLHVPPDMSQVPSSQSPSSSSTPVRRIPLYKSQQQSRTQKRTVVVHSDADINPLRPCGACNEWLKKIAECNPYFTIITFTDSACNGVYCTPCEE